MSELEVADPEHLANEQHDGRDYAVAVITNSDDDVETPEKRKFCSITDYQTTNSPESEKSGEHRVIANRKKMRIAAIDDTVDTNVVSDNYIPSKTVGDESGIREDLSSRNETDPFEQRIILGESESQMAELKSSQEKLKVTKDAAGKLTEQAQGTQGEKIMIVPRSESQIRLNTQDKELESSQGRLEELEDSRKDLSRQLQDTKWRNDSLKQLISDKERIMAEDRSDHREQLCTLENEAIRLRNLLAEVTSDKKELTEQLREARNEAKQFKKECDRWKAESRTLQDELVSIQEEESATLGTMGHSESGAIMSKLESLLQQRKEDKAEARKLKNELKSRENQVMLLLDERDELTKELKIAKTDVDFHRQKVVEKDHFIVQSTHHYETRLTRLQKENEVLAAKEQSQSDAISKLFKNMRDTTAGRNRKTDSGCEEEKAKEKDIVDSSENVKLLDDEKHPEEADEMESNEHAKPFDGEKEEWIGKPEARESDIKELQEKVKSLDHENAGLTQLLQVRESEMKRLQTLVGSLDEENSKLTKQLKARRDNMKESETHYKKLLFDPTERLEARESDVKKLQEQVKSLENEKRELSKRLETGESDSKAMQQTVSSHDDGSIQQSKSMLKEGKDLQYINEQGISEEPVDGLLQEKLVDCRPVIEAEIANLRKEKESLISEHSAAMLKLQAENERLQKQANRRSEAIRLLQEQSDTLEDDTLRLNRLMENTSKAHTTALEKLSEEKSELQKTVKAQNKELQLLRTRSEKDMEGQAKYSKIRKDKKALLAKEKKLKSRLKDSNMQLSDKKNGTLHLDRKNKAIMKEVERLNNRISGREKEVENLCEQLTAQSKELERLASYEQSQKAAFSQLLEEKKMIEENQMLLKTSNTKLQEELNERGKTTANLKFPTGSSAEGDRQVGKANTQLMEQAKKQEIVIAGLADQVQKRANIMAELITRVDALSQALNQNEPVEVEVNESCLQVKHTASGEAARATS